MRIIKHWLVAAAAAIAIGSTYTLDGPSDHEAAQDVASDVAQAKDDARKAQREVTKQ
jgi:hypothetical protein